MMGNDNEIMNIEALHHGSVEGKDETASVQYVELTQIAAEYESVPTKNIDFDPEANIESDHTPQDDVPEEKTSFSINKHPKVEYLDQGPAPDLDILPSEESMSSTFDSDLLLIAPDETKIQTVSNSSQRSVFEKDL